MTEAYFMVSTKTNKTDKILEEIKKIDGVEEAYPIYGQYDIITKFNGINLKQLRNEILKVRKMPNISKTLTLLVVK
jgi:DNA-binding Lrp family transcriptional regulator